MYVAEILEKWYEMNKRDLPWRNSENPYHIWLSEIILQQTRVMQGIDYYRRFVEAFPGIRDLAMASVDEVLKLWQGLGYYTRARNMHATAREIVNQFNGVFPASYDQILALKGIGPYTAAAIASIAFKIPVSVVDGNVSRVLSRLYAVETAVDSTKGKKIIAQIAHDLLNRKRPDIHNQALMEFGAMVCLPANPLCHECVLSDICMAKANGLVSRLPVKKQKKAARTRYFQYLVIRDGDHTYIKKRNDRDIWHSLCEFPLLETEKSLTVDELVQTEWMSSMFRNIPYVIAGPVKTFRHVLTHQTLICNFVQIDIQEPANDMDRIYRKVPLGNLNNYAVPRVIDLYLHDLNGVDWL